MRRIQVAALAFALAVVAIVDLVAGVNSVPHVSLGAVNSTAEMFAMAQIYRGSPRHWIRLHARGTGYAFNPKAPPPDTRSIADFNFLFPYFWAGANAAANGLLYPGKETVYTVWTGRVVLGILEILCAACLALFLWRAGGLPVPFAVLAGLHFLLAIIPINLGKIVSSGAAMAAYQLVPSCFFAWLLASGKLRGFRLRDNRGLLAAAYLVSVVAMLSGFVEWIGLAVVAIVCGVRFLWAREERRGLFHIAWIVHAAVASGLLILALHYWVALDGNWFTYMRDEMARHPAEPWYRQFPGSTILIRTAVAGWPYFAPPLFLAAAGIVAASVAWSWRMGALAWAAPRRREAAAIGFFLVFYLGPWTWFHLLFWTTMTSGPEGLTSSEVFSMSPYLVLGLVALGLSGGARKIAMGATALAIAGMLTLRVLDTRDGFRWNGRETAINLDGRNSEGYEYYSVWQAELIRLAWNLSHGYNDRNLRYWPTLEKFLYGPAVAANFKEIRSEQEISLFQLFLGVWHPEAIPTGYVEILPADSPWYAAIIDPGASRPGNYLLRTRDGDSIGEYQIPIAPDRQTLGRLPTILVEGKRYHPGFWRRLTEPQRHVWFRFEDPGEKASAISL